MTTERDASKRRRRGMGSRKPQDKGNGNKAPRKASGKTFALVGPIHVKIDPGFEVIPDLSKAKRSLLGKEF